MALVRAGATLSNSAPDFPSGATACLSRNRSLSRRLKEAALNSVWSENCPTPQTSDLRATVSISLSPHRPVVPGPCMTGSAMSIPTKADQDVGTCTRSLRTYNLPRGQSGTCVHQREARLLAEAAKAVTERLVKLRQPNSSVSLAYWRTRWISKKTMTLGSGP